MAPPQIIGSNSFQGGLVTMMPGHLLQDGQSPNTQNVDFSTSLGRLTKRHGWQIFQNANLGAGNPVKGLYEFIKADGTTFFYATVTNAIYEIAQPSTWTSRYAPGGAIGDTNFTAFNNLCIAVSPNITTVKNSGGGAFTALGGTPPANGSFIESHKGRVFIANTSAGKSRLHFSVLNNPEDWTTITGVATDAGFIDVGLDDGDVITGVKSIGTVLLVWKNTSTWAVFGTSPLDFKVKKLSPTVGCTNGKTAVVCDSFAIFLSRLGVYSANSDGVTMLSYNIKPTLDAFTTAQRAGACAGRRNTQYWLAYDSDLDGTNDTVYYLDYVYGVWGQYTNKKENIFYTRRNGDILSGGGDTDQVRQHDITDDDNGSAISMLWDTPDYEFNDWTVVKHPLDIMLSAGTLTGKTITITHLVDGVAQGTTLPLALTASGSQDKVFLTKRALPNSSYGRYIRFRFTNADNAAPVQIFAYSVAAYLDARQNSGA
jgi:hypothetical protein